MSQDKQPPTSVPKPVAQLCPQCQQPLNLLLEAYEWRTCVKCGWSERPPKAPEQGTLAELELKKLLEKAALESLGNMKPRKQQDAT